MTSYWEIGERFIKQRHCYGLRIRKKLVVRERRKRTDWRKEWPGANLCRYLLYLRIDKCKSHFLRKTTQAQKFLSTLLKLQPPEALGIIWFSVWCSSHNFDQVLKSLTCLHSGIICWISRCLLQFFSKDFVSPQQGDSGSHSFAGSIRGPF